MSETDIAPKRGKGGRPPKTDTATNCVMVRFTDREYADFLSMYEQSGVPSRAREFVSRLTALHGQIILVQSVHPLSISSCLFRYSRFRRRATFT